MPAAHLHRAGLDEVHLARHLALADDDVVLQVDLRTHPAGRPLRHLSTSENIQVLQGQACMHAGRMQLDRAKSEAGLYRRAQEGDDRGGEALLGVLKEGYAGDQVPAGVQAHLGASRHPMLLAKVCPCLGTFMSIWPQQVMYAIGRTLCK